MDKNFILSQQQIEHTIQRIAYQIYETFVDAKALMRQEPKKAGSRQEIRELLDIPGGGVFFTTIQKFAIEGTLMHQQGTMQKVNPLKICEQCYDRWQNHQLSRKVNDA